MLLKKKTAKLRDTSFLGAYSYRLPLPVRKVLIFRNNASYPICPRCGSTLPREYMRFCDRCGQKLSWFVYECASEIHAADQPSEPVIQL